MNKLYYFHGADDESGVFVGAATWREARNFAIGHECMDGSEFVEIQGRLCKENGKVVHTEKGGEHDGIELLALGYTGFWWSGYCEKCGEDCEMLRPKDGKLICSECENPEEDNPNEN